MILTVQGTVVGGTLGYFSFFRLIILLKPTLPPQQQLYRQTLRKSLRTWRQQLPASYQKKASQNACWKLALSPHFKKARHIAFYWPSQGEISPLPLLKLAQRQHKNCYLPQLPKQGHRLRFAKVAKAGKLTLGRFGIVQPRKGQATRPIQHLCLVIVPLVAFNAQGHRLGMGAGFYDRALAPISHQKKPYRIGLAYKAQYQPQLPSAPWDKRLQLIATDQRLWRANSIQKPIVI